MLKIYIEMLSIFLLIISGMVLRYFKIVKKEDASVLLNLVFYLTVQQSWKANTTISTLGFS